MESLQTFAELGVAIIGFSALISSLSKKGKIINFMRLLVMIETAALLTFFSMLPLSLSNFFSTEFSFQISLMLFGIIVSIFSIIMRKRSKKWVGLAGITNTLASAIIQLTGISLAMISILASINFLENSQGVYVLIMMGVLVIALVMFVRLIYFGLINFSELEPNHKKQSK